MLNPKWVLLAVGWATSLIGVGVWAQEIARAREIQFALAIVAADGQTPSSVGGTWTAAFDGRTFVRLELKDAAGTITGALALGDIEVDKQGVVNKVGALPRAGTPIFDVMRRGDTMSFSRTDSNDTDRFEVRFLQNSRAELRFMLTDEDLKELKAEGVPLSKPIALTRQQ